MIKINKFSFYCQQKHVFFIMFFTQSYTYCSIVEMYQQELKRISCDLYKTVKHKLGLEVCTYIWRTTVNLLDEVNRIQSELDNTWRVYFSGSKGEGFRFTSSDNDLMLVYETIKVIPPNASITLNDSRVPHLMMENEMTKPGFTLLRVIWEPTNPQWLQITYSKKSIHNGIYLSSKLWREVHTAASPKSDREYTHGPCTSGAKGTQEYDKAHCVRCKTWPANAQDCIRRLHQSQWPSSETILSVIKDGVLFVAIGAKQSVFENLEWRMSFSLAEKKLIHAMNHSQFLCYGLLKIFLKEAIDANSDVRGLMCSYFLKTSIFWEITSSPNDWNPSSFLSKFWKCFCRLLQWISCSYCPNFFIPQNNMFEGKIEGASQDNILHHLTSLYYEGFRCLLRCPSLLPYMSLVIHIQELDLQEQEISKSWIAATILHECFSTDQFRLSSNGTACIILQQLASTNSHNSLEKFILRIWFHRCMIQFCAKESIHAQIHSSADINKLYYKRLAERMHIFNKCRTDSVGHYLNKAILSYRTGKYKRVLVLVQHCKEALSSQKSFCPQELGEENYRQAGGENLPIEIVIRKSFTDTIRIPDDSFITELFIEIHGDGIKFKPGRLHIMPLICALFLQYLCYNKLGDLQNREEVLYDLSVAVHNDEPGNTSCAPTSLHILGICQQMKGDDQAACSSYLTALQHCDCENRHKVASCIRIATVLAQYFSS